MAINRIGSQFIGCHVSRQRGHSKLLSGLLTALLLSIGSMISASVHAAEPINTLERKGLWGYKESGVAIRGYDTVAYFTLGKPQEGSDQFTTEWMGATWKFANAEHLQLFESEPDKYAPQYGGYCAYGVVKDQLVKIEPDQWAIVDDKLYLNYDADIQKTWNGNIAGFIEAADQRFESLLKN